jgi:hypothetical protein
METSQTVGKRHIALGLAACILLITGLVEVYNLGEKAYYDYIFYPSVKEGYIIPTRWQDIVALILLWVGTLLLVYLSYRLLRYAFRPKSAGTNASI